MNNSLLRKLGFRVIFLLAVLLTFGLLIIVTAIVAGVLGAGGIGSVELLILLLLSLGICSAVAWRLSKKAKGG